MSQHSPRKTAEIFVEALSELLAEQNRALGAATDRSQLIQSQLAALISVARAGELHSSIGIEEINEPDQENLILQAALMTARRDIRTIQTCDAMRSPLADWLRDPSSRERVGIQMIIHSRILEYVRSEYRLAQLIQGQVSVRVAPLHPFQMVTIDDQFALIRHMNTVAVAIYQPTILQLISRIFEYCWNSAHELPREFTGNSSVRIQGPAIGSTAVRPRQPALSTEQLAILRLWAQGRPDDVIARELQVSIRTLRRIVSKIMNSLGVNNRFGAGLVAAQRYNLSISDQ
jgi:DNA-binding CsgD family transcriptional regulator